MNESLNKVIGLLIPNIHNDYMAKIVSGIKDKAESRGLSLFVFRGEALEDPNDYGYQNNLIYDFATSDTINGLIIASGALCNYTDKKAFEAFCRKFNSIPKISISVELPGSSSILIDNNLGIKQVLDHLITLHGYKNIAFIRGPENNPEAEVRYDTFVQCMKDYGYPVRSELIVSGDFTIHSGEEAVKALLKKLSCSIDAVLCANDDMAIGAIRGLTSSGFSVPANVAVVGFDDIESAKFSFPPLTTIKQPLYRQGELAVEQLCLLMDNKITPSVTMLQTELVTRLSCGCLPRSVADKITSPNESFFIESPVDDLPAGLLDTVVREILLFYKSLGLTELDKAEITKDTQSILKLLEKAITPQTQDVFLTIILPRLYDFVRLQKDPQIYAFSLNAILKAVRPYFKSAEKKFTADRLFESGQALIQEMVKTGQANRKYLDKQQFYQMAFSVQWILSSMSMNELTDHICTELKNLGIQSFYFIVYEDKITYLRGDKWCMPSNGEVLMAYTNGQLSKSTETRKFLLKHIIPGDLLPENRSYSLVIVPLCFLEQQYGYMLIELNHPDWNIYNYLYLQIRSAYRSVLLIQDQKSTEKQLRVVLSELEMLNNRLYNISETDELTGLFNRRGFIGIAKKQKDLCTKTNQNGILFFIDLDGLKKINDTYGHKAGDDAIQSAAQVLKNCFRMTDTVGRLGGDEFVALTIGVDQHFLPGIEERLKLEIDKNNRENTREFALSISMGYRYFEADETLEIEKIIQEADEELYKVKKEKKKHLTSPGG